MWFLVSLSLSLSPRWQTDRRTEGATNRQTGVLSSGPGMASSCEEKLISQSDQLASQRDHMRGAGSTHLGLVWVSRSVFIYVCVRVCVHKCASCLGLFYGCLWKQEVMTSFHMVYMRPAQRANTQAHCRFKWFQLFFLSFYPPPSLPPNLWEHSLSFNWRHVE